MLSLPLITPRDDSTLWPSHPTSRLSSLDSPVSSSTDPNNAPPPHHQQQRRPHSHHTHAGSTRSTLASLAADENSILQRKQNVRRFGAGWIRPPGVPKTYQATMDEAAEREEQEILARREQALADMAALQEAEELAAQREAGEEEGDGDEEERDLDDEVPEAEAEDSDEVQSTSEMGSEDGLEQTEAEMTFNEDSFIEGSMVQADVEQMLEMEEADMAGVLQDERDLDDDVPEAGSYQHTDTELEDESSEMEEMSFEGRRSGINRPQSGRRLGARSGAAARTSMFSEDGSSMMGGSSFVGSSPAAARGPGLGNAFRNRLMRPPPPRGG
ncbi:hypothetical protein BU16DRAFT_542843 [Lophium mytilinum]|uniref:Uncharacterized protein n=1 Tax=Lophium mytilinum TaxID=390894 RepID=A0A6A6QK25_9PEZI|nr:hypothetical protein BU16DRAFT_542843 [Lophium mytilinum]